MPTASHSPRATRFSHRTSAAAPSRSPARSPRGTPPPPERALAESNGLVVDYVEVAEFDPPVLAAAVRVGSTRLIDNVVLEGDPA